MEKDFRLWPCAPTVEPLQVLCQICKANISIFGKGDKDILRHHSTKKHLQKDHRWRYEHLARTDPFTKLKVHQVWDKGGKLPTPYQLKREFSTFKDAELVDIGEKVSYYDKYTSRIDFKPLLRTIVSDADFCLLLVSPQLG